MLACKSYRTQFVSGYCKERGGKEERKSSPGRVACGAGGGEADIEDMGLALDGMQDGSQKIQRSSGEGCDALGVATKPTHLEGFPCALACG